MLSRHSVQELRPRNTGAIRPGNQTRKKRGNTQQICYSFGSPPDKTVFFHIIPFDLDLFFWTTFVLSSFSWGDSWEIKLEWQDASWVKKSMEWQIYTSNEITSFDYSSWCLRHEIRRIGIQTVFKWLPWFLAKAAFKLMRVPHVHRRFVLGTEMGSSAEWGGRWEATQLEIMQEGDAFQALNADEW